MLRGVVCPARKRLGYRERIPPHARNSFKAKPISRIWQTGQSYFASCSGGVRASCDASRRWHVLKRARREHPFHPQREYAFIRDDLRRLVVTAVVLVAIMIGLLLVIDQ
jgi:hypothetical protein